MQLYAKSQANTVYIQVEYASFSIKKRFVGLKPRSSSPPRNASFLTDEAAFAR